MKFKHTLLSLLIILFGATALADDVAKVVILKGQVKAKLANGSIIDVKADQSLPEGAVLQTAEKSFVKLIFIDKSQMNLGPNSQMVINAFPKKEAGIITLVKGQLRSQVTKDYMEMDDKSKSKLYIKTKTAAMGIRGTDFQVNFNPENQNTSLITFEGKVAMAHIDRGEREVKFDQSKLEKVVSSDKAVMVTKGQISAVNNNVAERAMAPTSLGIKQLDALKENETGTKESIESDKKQFRNPLPPGADSAIFSNVTPEKAAPVEGADGNAKGNPNGFFNTKTGEYKLPAGSIIDLNTVNIVPPPANAVFDPNTKTYVVPESFGKIDKTTGEYKAPDGLKLGSDGKFILVDAAAYAKSQVVNKEEKKDEKKEEKKEDKKEDKKDGDKKEADKSDKVASSENGNRAPASTEQGSAPAGAAPATGPVMPKLPEVMQLPKDWVPPTAPDRAPASSGPVVPPPNICVQCIVDKNSPVNNAPPPQPTSTKTHVIFNAQ